MIKKIISKFLTICILLCFFAAWVKADTNYAELIARGTNTDISWFGSANGLNYAKKDNIYAFNLSGDRNRLAVNIADTFIFSQRNSPIKVTLTCFDEGDTSFSIMYDSFNSNRYENEIKESGAQSLTNTGTWKEFSFELDDASLSNHGLENSFAYDIAVKTNDSGTLYVRSVKIEKDAAAAESDPIIIMSEGKAFGNIYETGQQSFIINIDNISTGVCKTGIEATVIDAAGDTVWSEKYDSISIGAGGMRQQEISSHINRCGFFTLLIEADTENLAGKMFVSSDKLSFSVIESVKDSDRNNRIGISTHLIRSSNKEELIKLASKAGFGLLRDEMRWSTVEKSKKEYVLADGLKEVPNMTVSSGMDQLMILAYSNSLYTSEEMDAPTSESEVEGFKNYCRYIAQQYKGIVKYYEVWNEFNYTEFNKYGEGSGVYINLLKAAYEAVKEVDPEAQIIGVAAGGDDDNNGLNFMQRVFNYGGLPYMDAVSFHPYQWGGQWNTDRFVNSLEKVRGYLDSRGYCDMPIYVTEMGWSTGTDDNCVSELNQAVYSIEMFTTAMASGNCDKVIWYDMQDDGVSGDREHNFGLVRHGSSGRIPYEAKPVFVALAGLNKVIGNAEYVDTLNFGQTAFYCFKKASGTYAVVAWSQLPSESISLKLGRGKVIIYDMYGDAKYTGQRPNGIYTITTGTEPIYFESDSLPIDAESSISYTVRLMRGETEISSLDGSIQAGDKLNALVDITGAEAANALKIYAVINGSGTLLSVKECSVTASGTYEIPIEINKASDIESIYFLAWENNQMPVGVKKEYK